MARSKARGDVLAGEAWAAGCRDVQAAINWAARRGEGAGAPFQAAFRKVLAANASDPVVDRPTPADAPAETGDGPAGGRVRGKRSRKARPAPLVEAKAEPDPVPAKVTGPGGRGPRRTKPAGDQPEAKPGPVRRAAPAASEPGTPAEFVEDMRHLRHLLTKYGRKGLADLIGIIGG